MTDEADDPGAHGGTGGLRTDRPDDGRPPGGGQPAGVGRSVDDDATEGQRRCEVLAALGLAVTAAVMLRGYAAAGAYAQLTLEAVEPPSGWELVEVAAGASSLYPVRAEGVTAIATLVLAYLLVVEIGPGRWLGAIGTRVLQGVLAVGALLTLSGVIATVAALRHPGQLEGLAPVGPDGRPDAETLTTVLDRGGTALPVVGGAAVAAYVAWLASTALIELRRQPLDDDPPAIE